MPARKRTVVEMEAPEAPSPVPSDLRKLRNMWEFASLMQYIYLFGECVKINQDLDIDMLEMECTKPTPSDLLPQIGLALLKHVSSHRGLTPDIFDEYTRRQYIAKAPERNPFGEEEQPRKFTDLDMFTKIRVLHQLSTWTMISPTRFREYYATSVPDQTQWRIEPFGWDRYDRTYFILDDSRLYRQTQPQSVPVQPSKAKAATRTKVLPKKTKGSRSSKRQKITNGDADEVENEEQPDEPPSVVQDEDPDNGLGGARWECLAISHADFIDFVDGLRKSKDPNEKALVKRMQHEIMPEIERQAAARERKMAQQERERMNMVRLASAKRSSRLAGKQEKEKEQRDFEEAERRKREDLAMAHREQDKQKRTEEARESRMMTREQRLREREVKRILHEEELKKLEQQSEFGDTAEGRTSERQRKTEMERKKEELKQWTDEDGDWYFDCAICGTHGKNLDDGTHSIACENCDIWQHSSCHGIREQDAEKDDFHFLCASCSKPRQIKIRKTSTSPNQSKKEISEDPSSNQSGTHFVADQEKTDARGAKPEVVIPPRQSLPPQQTWNTSNAQPGVQSVLVLPQNANSPSNGSQVPVPNINSASHQQSNGLAKHNGHPLLSQSHLHNASKGVKEAPLKPSMSQQQQQHQNHGAQQHVIFNPHQHGFSRQHFPTTSSNQGMTPPNSQQVQAFKEAQARSYASPHASSQVRANATPLANGYIPNMTSSPTPSLSATQGQTSVRFSPSGQGMSANSHAYVPENNRPAPGAYSPMKHASPPASQARNLSNLNGHTPGVGPMQATEHLAEASHSPIVGPRAPTLDSSSPKVQAAGISPVKHDVPSSSPPNSIFRPADEPPRFDAVNYSSTVSSLPTNRDQRLLGPPSPTMSGGPSLAAAPALKPTVGNEDWQGRALQPPLKKQ